MTIRKLSFISLAAAIACWGTPASAVPIDWIAGTADWFTAGNWNPAQVPTLADDVSVNNGGTATAAVPGVQVQSLDVGDAGAANATGTVDVQTSTVLGSSGSLNVGRSRGAGTANGTLMGADNVLGFGNTDIGVVDNGGAGNATGHVDLQTGFLIGSNSSLEVGRTDGGGTADGTLAIGGGVVNFNDVFISFVETGATGNATGDVDVKSNDLDGDGTGTLIVGRTQAAGTADGSLTVAGTIKDFDGADIGTVDTGATGDATGVVNIGTGTMIGSTGSLNVGRSRGAGTANGTVNGADNVLGFGNTDIGVVDNGADGNATGNVELQTGFLIGSLGSLEIGRTNGGGSADGTVATNGGVVNFTSIDVGLVQAGGTGNAKGSLTARGGLSATNLNVGVSAGGGSATGLVDVDKSLGVISDTMTLGDGSTIHLGIDGFTRGLLYGGFDVQVAEIDGVLNLFFGFMPAAGIFDLIISGSDTGITGAFDMVNIYGLTPGTLAMHGVVLDAGVEIYRLEIGVGDPIPVPPPLPGPVPEPGALTLLGFGLAGLGFARRRKVT